MSAEPLRPPGAGADVDLTAAQQANEIEALKLLVAHTAANNAKGAGHVRFVR